MEPIKTNQDNEKPVAVLRLPELDAELVRVLARHYLVIVDADEREQIVTILLYLNDM